jgi:hypothetical protein
LASFVEWSSSHLNRKVANLDLKNANNGERLKAGILATTMKVQTFIARVNLKE